MHIPDGYLSPATTIPAYAVMAPVWGAAIHKTKKTLEKKSVPTLALCSAFSFLIMMFNIPIAGGSSAHAVGSVLIAILLGPWAAVISVSTTLLIQALVFGDGGILAFAMNCLNMAVIMPFTGYGVYRLFRGRADLHSGRGVAAAFAGGYVGVNLAALCAAVEFGVQPLLFRAPNGAPLYCPYPVSVSVPAMAFAHGLVVGPIEGAVTAAAVAYLVKLAPELFRQSRLPSNVPGESVLKRYKKVLVPFAVLILLTPLGLLATGTAFGEWSLEEIRQQLGYVPKGLAAMGDRWQSLFPDYSFPALGGGTLGSVTGYLLSAVIGILLILGLIFISSKLIVKEPKGNR